ncbi:type II secretion system F family protein [Acidipropionibacterium timonense]|uniref:type II secretion system F family protein n=1 Tax=Acidipropionibacterium timonense TaxID=2161818 RepID=UPI0010321D5D|nr:pilus assembly protein TadB [Acidipropionibacterium timonense]
MTASLAAALAIWVLLGPRRRVAEESHAGSGWRRWARWLLAPGGVVTGLLLGGPSGALWALMGVVVAATVWKVAGDHLARRRSVAAGRAVAQACRALSGRLQVGEIPATALAEVSSDSAVLMSAEQARRVGADVPDALLETSRQPGHEAMAALAHAWRLSDMTGAPMASSARAVAEGTARRARLAATLEAELAGPRASGRLMGLLPFAGMGLAQSIGAGPAHFLTGSWPGRLCLLAAVVMACVGVLWSEHLADRVQRKALP